MKLKTVKRIFVTFTVNHLLSGVKFFNAKRKLLRSIGIEIGENTKIVGPIYNSASLHIGDNCWIGKNLILNGNGAVYIGNNCDIAPEVTFLTGGHEIGDETRRAGKGQKYTIHVGDGTWIGARSTLLGDISVGKSCMIAACACVTRDIEDNTLCGGVPAKMIRKL